MGPLYVRLLPVFAKSLIQRAEIESDSPKEVDTYLSAAFKLLPSEALYVYGMGESIFRKSAMPIGLWPLLVCVTILALRFFLTKDPKGRPQWGAITLTILVFLSWVYSKGDTILGITTTWASSVATAVAILLGLLSPHLLKYMPSKN